MKNNNIPLLNMVNTTKINELIKEGWEFSLHFGNHSKWCDISGNSWEADFTKKMENGLWDNHESGYGVTPDNAVNLAYDNIKEGNRLKKIKL